jgi:hypothetical protein
MTSADRQHLLAGTQPQRAVWFIIAGM